MPSKYISKQEELSGVISDIINNSQEDLKYSRTISILCIKGFKEKMVVDMLEHFKKAQLIGINKKEDLIIRF